MSGRGDQFLETGPRTVVRHIQAVRVQGEAILRGQNFLRRLVGRDGQAKGFREAETITTI